MNEDSLERQTVWLPAYDARDSDPVKSGGFHGAEIRMYVHGPKGTVQFVIFTHWMLPEVQKELDGEPVDETFPPLQCRPLPADLGYHSFTPLYEDQSSIQCNIREDMPECYYDGSTLNAESVFELLIREGHEAVWKFMEECYYVMWPEEEKEEKNDN